MKLAGIDQLNDAGKEMFEKLTGQHIEWYFNDASRNNTSNLQKTLFDMNATIKVTGMDPPFVTTVVTMDEKDAGGGDGSETEDNGHSATDIDAAEGGEDDGGVDSANNATRKRRLSVRAPARQRQQQQQQEQQDLTITYSQTISYRVSGTDDDLPDLASLLESIITEPFNNIKKRIKYLETLKKEGDGSFDAVKHVTLPTIQDDDVVPEEDEPEGLNIVLIAVFVVGGIIVLFLLGVIHYKVKSETKRIPRRPFNLPIIPDSGTIQTDPHAGVMSSESIADLADQERSVATIDHDYMPPHHSSEVSTSGGTIGSATRLSRFSGADSILTPGNTTGTHSIFTDDASFENHLNPKNPNSREDVFDVIAPPGKLGVVIDTPNSGAPVVYNIKENCPLKDLLMVGDKVICVDGEDVRSMTAVKVARLISKRSANPTRTFTIMRSIDG